VGDTPPTIALIVFPDRSSHHGWPAAAHPPAGGAANPPGGPPPRLCEGQWHQLERLLEQGAKAHGWPNQLWTAARVAALVRRHFGVSYHPDHLRRALRTRLGWTSQKPRRKAKERDEDGIARWLRQDFPRIVQGAWERSAYLVLLDESGFQLTPSVRRTLAKRGRTPVLEAWDRRDRISAISSITVSPRAHRLNLHFQLLPDNENAHGEDIVEYLRQLRAALRGPMTIIWDRSRIHRRSGAVKAYLAKHPEIVTEEFPAYAPELNPDEGVWGWTKYGRLSNLAAENTDVLRDHLIDLLVDLKLDPGLLASFIEETNLPLVL
jgi:transposase